MPTERNSDPSALSLDQVTSVVASGPSWPGMVEPNWGSTISEMGLLSQALFLTFPSFS